MILLKWLDDQLKEDLMSDLYQSLAHSKWDCKYHVVFVPKRRRKVIFGNIGQQLGAIFRLGETEGVPDRGRASDAGPCAYVHRDPTEAPGGVGDWVSERKECHRDRTVVRKGEELLWRTLLGPRLRRCPRSGSSWNKYASTSASRKRRMA